MSQRSPDVAWIKLERWNLLTKEQQASFAPICPDFIVELRSASDSLISLQNKMDEYIANGTSLGLLIDRKSRTVYVYHPDQPVEELNHPELVNCQPELQGFNLHMKKIW